MATKGTVESEQFEELISKYKRKVKNVVVGCTHYPLVKEEITEILGDVRFFDGAPSLAKHLKDVLIEKKLLINRSDLSINESNGLKLNDVGEHYKNSKDNNDSEHSKNSKDNNDSEHYKKINIEFIDSSS